MAVTIKPADFAKPELGNLVRAHNEFCNATAPAESCHNLTVAELEVPEITLWVAEEDGGALLGMGGLMALGGAKGEVKSMHTLQAARGKGVGRMLFETVLREAKARGYESLWLETGSMEAFAPARRLYARAGFTACPPFGSYRPDPLSAFYTLDLQGVAA